MQRASHPWPLKERDSRHVGARKGDTRADKALFAGLVRRVPSPEPAHYLRPRGIFV